MPDFPYLSIDGTNGQDIVTRLLFIHPPVAKPGGPPAGIARLKGCLDGHGIPTDLIDASLEGLLWLLDRPVSAKDRWTVQAFRNRQTHLSQIRSGAAFKTIHHYNRIVRDIGRLISHQALSAGYSLGLADCTHTALSPLKSRDLILSAETFDRNPYYGYFDSLLRTRIEAFSPDIIGLSVNFLSQALCAFALIGFLKQNFPEAELVLGGGLITSWMRNPEWRDPFHGWVDACVEGPGEPYFLKRLGISCIHSEYAPHYDTFTLLPYLSPGFILPYAASSGCYWRQCRFCPECAEKNMYQPVPNDLAIRDLHALGSRTAPVLIHFLDNALSPAFLQQWIGASENMPWYGYMRFTDELLDPDFCRKLRKSGCVMLKLGLESGSQAVLNRMHKGIDLNKAGRILDNLHGAGIPTYIYLLFGTPYESEKEAGQTLAFVADHHRTIGFINPAIFNMPAAGPDAGYLPTRPFSEGDLSLYVDFDHPLGWDRLKVRHFLDREFRRTPEIARILARTPKVFTSNHAPFFHPG
ncbi:radical SAM protein [bacterium]|nr:radical SAM protein [bacterium]